MAAETAGSGYQLAEVWVEFGCATCQVERIDSLCLDKPEDRFDHLGLHHLRAVRSGVDVAVQALLITTVSEIDLQGSELPPLYRREVTGLQSW